MIKILATLLASAALTWADNVNATSIRAYEWQDDSPTAFTLVVLGTGVPYVETLYQEVSIYGETQMHPYATHNVFEESFTSPSGLWELTPSIDVIAYLNRGQNIFSSASATFNGLETLNTFLDTTTGAVVFQERDWNGRVGFYVTSQPSSDAETWDWIMWLEARGPELHSVPDNGTTAAMLAFALVCVCVLRRRIRTQLTRP